MSENHRKAHRYNLRLRASVVNDDGTGHYEGLTKDISEQGLSIIYPHNVMPTENVTILVSLDGPLIEIVGHVIYTVYSSTDQNFRSGIVFKKFNRNGKERLKAFLESKIKY